jgi:predicted  nucleic acid-binding Zn-ribbon protein
MNNVDSINRQILELNHRRKKLELEINGINSTIQFLREQKELLEGAKGTNQTTYDDLLSD